MRVNYCVFPGFLFTLRLAVTYQARNWQRLVAVLPLGIGCGNTETGYDGTGSRSLPRRYAV